MTKCGWPSLLLIDCLERMLKHHLGIPTAKWPNAVIYCIESRFQVVEIIINFVSGPRSSFDDGCTYVPLSMSLLEWVFQMDVWSSRVCPYSAHAWMADRSIARTHHRSIACTLDRSILDLRETNLTDLVPMGDKLVKSLTYEWQTWLSVDLWVTNLIVLRPMSDDLYQVWTYERWNWLIWNLWVTNLILGHMSVKLHETWAYERRPWRIWSLWLFETRAYECRTWRCSDGKSCCELCKGVHSEGILTQ